MVELSNASSEVLPNPTPTAGTLPTCLDPVELELEVVAWAWEPIGLVAVMFDGRELDIEAVATAAWPTELA